MCLPSDSNHSDRELVAVGLVRRDCWSGVDEQAFHTVLWVCSRSWHLAHCRTQGIFQAVDLDRRWDCSADLSAQCDMAGPTPFSDLWRPPQRAGDRQELSAGPRNFYWEADNDDCSH